MSNALHNRLIQAIALLALAFGAQTALADDDDDSSDDDGRAPNTVEVLASTEGAQALVGAVVYVEGAGVLDFSLVSFLSENRYVLFAPSNSAFENLLALPEGALDGLTASDIASALGELVPAEAVAGILLKHVVPTNRPWRATESALLRAGTASAADGTELVVGIGAKGVEVNDSTITKSDVRSRNSLIHFIDTVIL